MPKTMTPKQLAANRRNAAKSTGPRTHQGKAVSKLNALKHGILSKEVLVRGLSYQESQREFAALHQRFQDQLQPAGPVEEMLVDQIVTTHWRLRRALTAEAGEIALSVDGGHQQRSRAPDPKALWAGWGWMGADPVPNMQESSLGVGVLKAWLRNARQQVEADGELTEAAIGCLGEQPNRLKQQLAKLRDELRQNPESVAPATLRERNRQRALTFLDTRRAELEWLEARCKRREEKEEESRQAAAVLPSLETLERILRYETKLERQQYRAMAQLERLQRMRQGEAVPAPLSVEVSERGRD